MVKRIIGQILPPLIPPVLPGLNRVKRRQRVHNVKRLESDATVIIRIPSPYDIPPSVVEAVSGDYLEYDGDVVIRVIPADEYAAEYEKEK